MLTISQLRESQKPFLSVEEVSGVLGANPHSIRVTARQRPELIGFPFTFSGNRMKIPRIPFLRFIGEDV